MYHEKDQFWGANIDKNIDIDDPEKEKYAIYR